MLSGPPGGGEHAGGAAQERHGAALGGRALRAGRGLSRAGRPPPAETCASQIAPVFNRRDDPSDKLNVLVCVPPLPLEMK